MSKDAVTETRDHNPVKNDKDATATIFSFPMSYAQERLWFLEQLEPDNAVYRICDVTRIEGALDPGILVRSIQDLIRRHESLRTAFTVIDGEPVQLIHEEISVDVPFVDMSGLSFEVQEREIARLAAMEERHGFTLDQAPLLRARLLRLAEDLHVLLLTIHHILMDGQSMQILYRDLETYYTAHSRNQPVQLPDLPIQYADFAVWQREHLDDKAMADRLAYWTSQLQGSPPLLVLPTDFPRPASLSAAGSSVAFSLSEAIKRRLEQAGRESNSTLFMVLFAAFVALLYRYSGQKDLLVATPMMERGRQETGNLIGHFLNPLVIRTTVQPSDSFQDLLGSLRETLLEAYEHQELPFEKLVERLNPDRNLSHAPLYQVMFSFQQRSGESWDADGSMFAPYQVGSRQATDLDLELEVTETKDGLDAILQYSTDLFTETTIQRMAQHFVILLEAIADDGEAKLLRLPLLSASEQQDLLVNWNSTERDFSADRCFWDLFEEKVQAIPDATAAVFNDTHISYSRLKSRATQFAAVLREQGVGRGSIVPLLADRDISFLVAMLAIFRVGGVYLPLDPRFPSMRLKTILEQSRSKLVVTTEPFLPVLGEADARFNGSPIKAINLTQALRQAAKGDHGDAEKTQANDLVYIIFTSGSTGAPKGAMVEQLGMINHLYAKIHDLHLTSEDVIAQTASQSFDISVWQFLVALLVGGTVRIWPDEVAHDPARILEELARQKITILETVPSLLRTILEEDERTGSDGAALPWLRWMMPTGEALPVDLARQWLSRHPQVALINAYGPTECSDDVTHFPLFQAPGPRDQSVPIGRPIQNTRIYILNEALQPVPIGVAGELFVGGVGVGRGYLHAPSKTAEVFIPDPFSDEPGARLYKTGDRARYRPDKTLEFLGRIDYQVKVRGFRIEPGEVEAALIDLEAVREAVVMARQVDQADHRLIAYIVPRSGDPHLHSIKKQLRTKLPDYMVPGTIVVLEKMPLTSNGKVNRRALPIPEELGTGSEKPFLPPSNAMEEFLVKVFQEVLGSERIGIEDSFFDLGGHSLLATKAIGYIREVLDMDIPLRTIFQSPAPKELSQSLLAAADDQETALKSAQLFLEISQLSEKEVEDVLDEREKGKD